MCGRGGLNYSWKTVWEYLNLAGEPPDGGPEILNLAPSSRRGGEIHWSRAPAVRARAGRRVLSNLVWPLVPPWLKGDLPKFSTANCRSEPDQPFSQTVSGKPAFRGAWKHGRRCLVPFSHFFEWDQRSKPKQPWRVMPVSEPLLVMAGLWEASRNDQGETIDSFTIVTTGPNRLLEEIGHHRSPVMLQPEEWSTWLRGNAAQAEALVRPPPDGVLQAEPVSRRVNNPEYEGEDLLPGG